MLTEEKKKIRKGQQIYGLGFTKKKKKEAIPFGCGWRGNIIRSLVIVEFQKWKSKKKMTK